jgi:hypothetical protein
MPLVKTSVEAHDRIPSGGKIPCGQQTDMSGIAVKHNPCRGTVVVPGEVLPESLDIVCGSFPVHPNCPGDVRFVVIVSASQIQQEDIIGVKKAF